MNIFTISENRFNVSEFSRGNIMGANTGAELGVKDTFYLGRFAHSQNQPEVAIKWLEEAALQAATDGGEQVEEAQVKPFGQHHNIYSLIVLITYKVNQNH